MDAATIDELPRVVLVRCEVAPNELGIKAMSGSDIATVPALSKRHVCDADWQVRDAVTASRWHPNQVYGRVGHVADSAREDKVFPIKDMNPTHHVAFLTIALIVINIAMFAFVQDRGPSLVGVTTPDGTDVSIPEGDKFNLHYAAIPCEITQRRALDFSEVQEVFRATTDRCDDVDRDQLFPNKSVALSVLASMFLHGDWFHLLFNMWFLWLFGNNIEDHLGPVRFVAFYLLAGVAATATHVALQPDSAIPLIGASGAIAGVMGTYLIWFPRAPIRTYVFPFFVFNIRAIWLLLAWFVLQFFTGTDSQIAWGAHVGGFVFGVIVGALIRQVRALCRRAWREPWRSRAYYRWDLTGGSGDGFSAPATRTRLRFGRRRW